MNSPANQPWPTTFFGHLNLIINPYVPLTPLAAFISIIISLIFCKQRRILLIWIAASVILYLNPLVAPFIIEKVTSRPVREKPEVRNLLNSIGFKSHHEIGDSFVVVWK
jgi:phosphoglycerol transferase MdoB-like AlkP superfamily enzyme